MSLAPNDLANMRMMAAKWWLGEKCTNCGKEGLQYQQLDHIDPTSKTKTHSLRQLATWKDGSLFWEEVDKCQLLCANCHIDKTNEDREHSRIRPGRPKKL